MDAMIQSDYPDNNKDIIISIVYDNFMNKEKTSLVLIEKLNNRTKQIEKIIVVRDALSILVGSKYYDVTILIYLPKFFPTDAPEIYIERNEELGVNPNICKMIDPVTFGVKCSTLINWNKSKSTIDEVINELFVAFSSNFPVYRLEPKECGKKYGPDCVIYNKKIIPIDFEAPSVTKSVPNNSYMNNLSIHSNVEKYKNEQVKTNHVPQQNLVPVQKKNKVYFSDEQIRQFIVAELFEKVQIKIRKDSTQLKAHEQFLLKQKDRYTEQKAKIQKLVEKEDDIIKNITTLSASTDSQIANFRSYMKDKETVQTESSNVESLIHVSNEKVLRLVAMEALIEELLTIFRRAYEKKILSYDDCIKYTRNVSRELFKIKTYRDKL